MGEHHHQIVSVDGSTNVSIKTPQLRNMYKKVGFEATQLENTSGFGFLHDGSVDSIARFVSEPAFSVVSDQDVANMVAFMLAFSGSELPTGTLTNFFEPPGTSSQDSHAAVGVQITFDGSNNTDAGLVTLLDLLESEAIGSDLDIIAKGIRAGETRGWVWTGLGMFQSDRTGETIAIDTLRLEAAAGAEITFTAVPEGSGVRAGIDRDEDGFFDRDEIDQCADPADPTDVPVPGACGATLFVRGDCNTSGSIDISDALFLLGALFGGGGTPHCDKACDVQDGGSLDIADAIGILAYLFSSGADPLAPFPNCGVDPTADSLTCTAAANCP